MTEQAFRTPGRARETAAPAPRLTPSGSRIAAVARNTFREAVRDRVLYTLVLFALLLVAGTVFLGEISHAQDAKLIVDFGLTALLLFGACIAVLVGVGLVAREIERRTVLAILAKPVRRGEFLVGKYAGLWLTLAVNVAVMGVGVSAALAWARGVHEPLVWRIWPAIGLIMLELSILTALALLFSTFASPALSALFAFVALIVGHLSAHLQALAALLAAAPARAAVTGLYYALPNFSLFTAIAPAAHGLMPSPAQMGTAALYALVYAAVAVGLAALVLERRDFR